MTLTLETSCREFGIPYPVCHLLTLPSSHRFGDPFWYQDWASPYYNDSHRKVRSAIRKYTDEHLTPNAYDWDEAREIPADAYKHVASAGILAGIAAGADGWLTEYAGDLPIPGKVKPDEWDAFTNFVLVDELCRCGSGGILYGLIGGFGIGLPPIVHFGTDEQKNKWVPGCLKGDLRVCLAITEVRRCDGILKQAVTDF